MRLTNCACNCGNTTTNPKAHQWHETTLANRGGRVAYICPSCARHIADYSADNNAPARGTATNNGLTFGFEFECNRPTITFRAQMQHYNLLPSSDCTVDLEFKSPVYRSLNPIKGFLRTVETLINDGQANVGENCGTHFHVGHHTIHVRNIRIIAAYYTELFQPLSNAMRLDPLGCSALFGRSLGEWADSISSYPYDHRNFINIEHNNTLEWRVCKFVNAAQYMRAAKTCKAFTACIITNFLAYVNTPEKLSHKANVTAKKLVRIYEKAVCEALKA